MCTLPFELAGYVIEGKRLGSRLGFPTANLLYDPSVQGWPREGVYVGIASVEGESRGYVAILNQGRHPTAPGGVPTVEAHLLGHPDHALYGKRIRLRYCLYLRGEQRFASLDALKDQLSRDRHSAVLWARANAPELLLGLRLGGSEGEQHGTEEV